MDQGGFDAAGLADEDEGLGFLLRIQHALAVVEAAGGLGEGLLPGHFLHVPPPGLQEGDAIHRRESVEAGAADALEVEEEIPAGAGDGEQAQAGGAERGGHLEIPGLDQRLAGGEGAQAGEPVATGDILPDVRAGDPHQADAGAAVGAVQQLEAVLIRAQDGEEGVAGLVLFQGAGFPAVEHLLGVHVLLQVREGEVVADATDAAAVVVGLLDPDDDAEGAHGDGDPAVQGIGPLFHDSARR